MRAKNWSPRSTSAFVCAALSIVPTVRHADYLGSWLEVPARGQSRDHPRGQRGLESGRLSARVSRSRAASGRTGARGVRLRGASLPSPLRFRRDRSERKRAERGFVTGFPGRETALRPPVTESPSHASEITPQCFAVHQHPTQRRCHGRGNQCLLPLARAARSFPDQCPQDPGHGGRGRRARSQHPRQRHPAEPDRPSAQTTTGSIWSMPAAAASRSCRSSPPKA